MNEKELMARCLVAAARIVGSYARLLPPGITMLAGGGGKGKVDTRFRRAGVSSNQNAYSLPSSLAGLVNTHLSQGSMGSEGLQQGQNSFLSGLFERANDPGSVPGSSMLTNTMNLVPTSFDGDTSLRTMAARNPYSNDFEESTQDAFKQRSSDAMSSLQSGPSAVRGGQSRSGIAQGVAGVRLAQERGREVRDAQAQDAGIVHGASQLLNIVEAARRGLQLQAQGQAGGQQLGWASAGAQGTDAVTKSRAGQSALLELAARLLGSQTVQTNDDLTGRGAQTSQQTNWSFLRGILG